MIPVLCPPPPYIVPTTMIDVLTHLGLTTSLQVCLDAGDLSSYDGSSQTWTDLSGNGNHYYRGSGSGSDASDPTFNGVAGRQSSSEYWSSDGGDIFTPTGSPAFADTWHKDNATFTIASWVWVPSSVASPPGFPLISTRGTNLAVTPGMSCQIAGLASTGRLSVNYTNGSSIQAVLPPTQDTIVEGTWMFALASLSEGSGASFVRVNGTVELMSSDTYVSPSSSAKTTTPTIWQNATDQTSASGSRMNCFLVWSNARSQADATALYNATKGKFGL